MFPDKPGGISLYAHEGWRKYFTLVGPDRRRSATGSPGRSCSRSSAYSRARSSRLPGSRTSRSGARSRKRRGRGYFSTGNAAIGLPHLIAIGLILAVWLFNIIGVRVAVGFGYLAGALLMIPLVVFIVLPFLTGDFDSANMTWGALDGTAGSGDEATSVSNWEICGYRSSGSGSWPGRRRASRRARRSPLSTRTRSTTRSSRSVGLHLHAGRLHAPAARARRRGRRGDHRRVRLRRGVRDLTGRRR